jgi:transporter family protein
MRLVATQEAGATCAFAAGRRQSNGAARAYKLIFLLLLLNPLGNLLLAWGLKHFPSALAINPLEYLSAMVTPLTALGIALLILAFFTRMVLFSIADLSFMLPITASGYVIAAVYGKLFLGEQISAQRWLGTALIFVGIAFVGSTSVKTTAEAAPAEA